VKNELNIPTEHISEKKGASSVIRKCRNCGRVAPIFLSDISKDVEFYDRMTFSYFFGVLVCFWTVVNT